MTLTITRSDPEKRLLHYDPGPWFYGTCLEFKRPVTTLERMAVGVYEYESLPYEDQLACEGMGRLCQTVLKLPEPLHPSLSMKDHYTWAGPVSVPEEPGKRSPRIKSIQTYKQIQQMRYPVITRHKRYTPFSRFRSCG